MTIAPSLSILTAPSDDDDIIIDEVGAHQWRVLDTRVPSESVAALIGFVSMVLGVYEVTVMARPRETSLCPDLLAARAAFLGQL